MSSITNAGAIFLGMYTAEALGDYMAGPNHVLPTGGTARFFSPLGVYDFIKRSSVIWYEREALMEKAGMVAQFARLEGLEAHARAVDLRVRRK
jgi:histidinol dehydrogenase